LWPCVGRRLLVVLLSVLLWRRLLLLCLLLLLLRWCWCWRAVHPRLPLLQLLHLLHLLPLLLPLRTEALVRFPFRLPFHLLEAEPHLRRSKVPVTFQPMLPRTVAELVANADQPSKPPDRKDEEEAVEHGREHLPDDRCAKREHEPACRQHDPPKETPYDVGCHLAKLEDHQEANERPDYRHELGDAF